MSKPLYNREGGHLAALMSAVSGAIAAAKAHHDLWDKKRAIEDFAYKLSGDHNKELRQDVYTYLIGHRFPKAKCGINAIIQTMLNKAK